MGGAKSAHSELMKEITAKLKLNSKEFSGAMSSAQKQVLAFSATITGLGASVLAVAKITATYEDAMIKSARAAGTSVEQFTAYAHAADMSGVSSEEFGKALTKLNSQSPEVVKNLANLGIATRKTNGDLKSGNELLNDIADKMSKLKSPSAQTAFAVKALGEEGAKMVSMLNGGSAGLKAATKEAERLGLIVSTQAAVAAEKFNDEMALTTKTIGGFTRAIGDSVIEFVNQGQVMQVVRDTIAGLTQWWRGLDDGLKSAIITTGAVVVGLAAIVTALIGLQAIATAVGKAVTAMFGPVGIAIQLIIGALTAIGYAVIRYWSQIKSAFEPLSEAFETLKTTFTELGKKINDWFSPFTVAADDVERLGKNAEKSGDKVSYLGTAVKSVGAVVSGIINSITYVFDQLGKGIETRGKQIEFWSKAAKAAFSGNMEDAKFYVTAVSAIEKQARDRAESDLQAFKTRQEKIFSDLIVKQNEAMKGLQKPMAPGKVESVGGEKQYSEIEKAVRDANKALVNFNKEAGNMTAAKRAEDLANAFNAVAQKVTGYAQAAIGAFAGIGNAIAQGMANTFQKEDQARQVAILKFTKDIDNRIKATEEGESARIAALTASYDNEIALLQSQEAEKLAIAEQAGNERLLLMDSEYQAAKEKQQKEHEAFMQAERERYEQEKLLLLEKAVDKEQRQLVNTEMDEGFRQYTLMLEQQFQQRQSELAAQYADQRKNKEATNKEQIKAIETNSKAAIEALTKEKALNVQKAEDEKNAKLKALEEEKNTTLQKMEKERTRKKWEAEVAQFKATKAAKTAEIMASGIAAAAAGFAAVAGIPFIGLALGAAIAATIMATTIANVANLQGQEPVKPAELELGTGGVMGGNFSHASGNDIPARLESGEAVIDRGRTRDLFSALDSGAMGGKTVNVIFENGSIQTTEVVTESFIDRLSERVVKRVELAGGFA